MWAVPFLLYTVQWLWFPLMRHHTTKIIILKHIIHIQIWKQSNSSPFFILFLNYQLVWNFLFQSQENAHWEMSNVIVYLTEPNWGAWTTLTDCTKISQNNCVGFRSRNCTSSETLIAQTFCTKPSVETSACTCPTGDKTRKIWHGQICVSIAF